MVVFLRYVPSENKKSMKSTKEGKKKVLVKLR